MRSSPDLRDSSKSFLRFSGSVALASAAAAGISLNVDDFNFAAGRARRQRDSQAILIGYARLDRDKGIQDRNRVAVVYDDVIGFTRRKIAGGEAYINRLFLSGRRHIDSLTDS